MSRLSEEARLIVRVLSMLRNEHIPEDLIQECLREILDKDENMTQAGWRMRFNSLVLGELIYDSSLLRQHRNKLKLHSRCIDLFGYLFSSTWNRIIEWYERYLRRQLK